MSLSRRDLFKLSAVTVASGAVGAAPLKAAEATAPELFPKKQGIRVVVCGGGFGGLTTAKYLKKFNPACSC